MPKVFSAILTNGRGKDRHVDINCRVGIIAHLRLSMRLVFELIADLFHTMNLHIDRKTGLSIDADGQPFTEHAITITMFS